MAAGSAIPTMTQIAVTTAPVLLSAGNTNRKRLSIAPLTASVDLYIGASSTMSSTSGYPVFARTSFDVNAGSLTTGAIYGCSTAACTVGVLGY